MIFLKHKWQPKAEQHRDSKDGEWHKTLATLLGLALEEHKLFQRYHHTLAPGFCYWRWKYFKSKENGENMI